MILEPVSCPRCNEIEVIKHGKTAQGKQRYRSSVEFGICRGGEEVVDLKCTGLDTLSYDLD